MRRGQTWQVEEMLKLFLVIMVFGGATLLIIAASGGLTSVLNDFCEKNPSWCGSNDEVTVDYLAAKASVEALVCAINTVATGKPDIGCSDFFGKAPASVFDDNSAEEAIDSDTRERLDIQGNIVSKDIRDFMTGFVTSVEKDPVISCQEDYSKCNLYNFVLPQETSAWENYIKGYGDPRFLVYWQNFPEGEDKSWSGNALWGENVYDIIFAWWGAGKVMSIGKGAAKVTFQYTVKKGIYSARNAYSRIMTRDPLEYFIKHTLEKPSNVMLKREVANLGKEAITRGVGNDVATLIKRGIKLTPLAVGAALIDSHNSKYKSFADSLILKSPYKDPEDMALQLDKTPIFLRNKAISFYLASPCSSKLDIEKALVECSDGFAFNLVTEDMKCNEPKLEIPYRDITGSEFECRKDKHIKYYFPGKDPVVPDRISSLDGKNQMMISSESGTGEERELVVRDPIHGVRFFFEKGKKVIPGSLIGGCKTPTDLWILNKISFEDSNGNIQNTFNVIEGQVNDNGFLIDISGGTFGRGFPNGKIINDLGDCEFISGGIEIDNDYCFPMERIELKPENFDVEISDSESITYEEGRGLSCKCSIDFMDFNVNGQSISEILSTCASFSAESGPSNTQDAGIYACSESGTKTSGSEEVTKCDCNIEQELQVFENGGLETRTFMEKYPVYGLDESNALERCQSDFDAFARSKGEPKGTAQVTNCGSYSGDFGGVTDTESFSEYVETLGEIKSIKYEIKSEEIKTEGGESKKRIEYNSLVLNRDDFSVAFTDKDSKITEEDGIVAFLPDGIADTIGIDSVSWYEIGWNSFPDQVILEDIDFDGTVDSVSTKLDCKMSSIAIGVDKTEGVTGDSHNFCFAPNNRVREAFRWAPEAGILLGGAAGLLGGPFAELSVPAGAAIGQRLGAAVFTVYAVQEKFNPGPDIWPGEKL